MTPLLELGFGLLDKLTRFIPDSQEKEKAKYELYKLSLEGELKTLETTLSTIIAEAQSQDKWTSRARPSFLYVMYAFLLTSIPMGIVFACKPEVAQAVSQGVGLWLAAIPEQMWWLFGTGYLGYSGLRSWDKRK